MLINLKKVLEHVKSGDPQQGDNFIYLTIALIILLLAGAIGGTLSASVTYRLVQSATIVTLALGVWSVRSKQFWFQTGLGFFVAILLVTIAGFIFDSMGLQYTHILIMLGFFSLTVWEAIRQMLFTGTVNSDKIVGSLCIFLLLGIIWALLYIVVTLLDPSAFKGLDISVNWQHSFNDFVYFSFVTLTTLGYGDIVPLSQLARFLTYMEAIVGQFYIAILVASLIGVRIAEYHGRK